MARRRASSRRRLTATLSPLDWTPTTVDRDMAVLQWPPGDPFLVTRYGCLCEPGGNAIKLSCPIHTVVWDPNEGAWRMIPRHTVTPEPVEPEPEWDWLYEPF